MTGWRRGGGRTLAVAVLSLLVAGTRPGLSDPGSGEGAGPGGVSGSGSRSGPGKSRDIPVRAVFEGGASLELETVDTPEARTVGLMYRKSLPEGWGMLFVFEEPELLSFWMRNTHVPLSIAFVDDGGRILNIRDMRPLDETTRHRSKGPARYAIEVERGWFEARGIRAGSRVRFLYRSYEEGELRPRIPGEKLVVPVPRRPEGMVPVGPPIPVKLGGSP